MTAHFTEESFDFLEELEHHNDRPWFAEHRDTYERELKARMLEIVADVNTRLAGFAPEHVRPPAKAMMRIYRDVRFAKDKTPYKTTMSAYWPRQGLEKNGAAGFYVQIGAHGVMIAGGAYSPGAPQLLAVRRYLLEHHQSLRAILTAPALTARTDAFDGQLLLRAPRGFPPEHPALDLLRCRRYAVTATLPFDAALRPDFADTVAEHFRLMTPLVYALNVPLALATPIQVAAQVGR